MLTMSLREPAWSSDHVALRLRLAALVVCSIARRILTGDRQLRSELLVRSYLAQNLPNVTGEDLRLMFVPIRSSYRLPIWRPTRNEFDQANETWGWRELVHAGNWDMMILRASDVSWRWITRYDGRSERTLSTQFKLALGDLALILDELKVPLRLPDRSLPEVAFRS